MWPRRRFASRTLFLAFVCLTQRADALDPNRTIAQYLRAAWGDDQGFRGGAVTAIAQSPDGYLWIGTDRGLVRFDGSTFTPFQQAVPTQMSIGPVLGLAVDAQGDMWVLLRDTTVFRYRGGTFEAARDEAAVGISAVAKRRDGRILLSSLALGAMTHAAAKYETLTAPSQPVEPGSAVPPAADDQSSRLSWATGVALHRVAPPGSPVVAIAETSDGIDWLGAHDKGLFSLKDGKVSSIPKGDAYGPIHCLLPLENGELWVGTATGVVRWNGVELTRAGLPPGLLNMAVLSLLRDRDANIWIGTSRGIYRFDKAGNLSGDTGNQQPRPAVTALFEDREGDVWMGTANGIERLRDSSFVTYSLGTGAPSEGTGPVYADAQGRTWVAPLDGGLYWLKGGQIERIAAPGLDRDVVYSIAGEGDEVWVGRQRGGLTRLRLAGDAIESKTYIHADGLAQDSVYAVHRSRDGSIWAGTLSGGVSHFKAGKFTSYTTANGMASNTVTAIAEGGDGTLLFATPNGLTEFAGNGFRIYAVRDGLPSADLNCLFVDSGGVLWIGSQSGLAFLSSGQIQTPPNPPEALRNKILAVQEDRYGWLWIATANKILRVKRDTLMSGKIGPDDLREYGVPDGLHGTQGVKRERSVAVDSGGHIWISTDRGLSRVDPARAAADLSTAIVHMETVSVDGNPVDPPGKLVVSSPHQRMVFSYAGLSLAMADRLRFRYRLDGFDRGWSEPMTARQAVYTNLGPGPYRFRVQASTSDGVWNGDESTLPFEVEPAFWQTWWFQLSWIAALILAAWLYHAFRLQQSANQLKLRFDERLAERMRIAQELHDTLLQGFLSASMQLHVATDKVPDNSPAKPLLGRVLQLMTHVTEEGRNTLRGLRSTARDSHDLEQALSAVPREMSIHGDVAYGEVAYRVVVEGQMRTLRPAVRDEVYRIGREALVNAFRHAKATEIEAEIRYGNSHFQLAVRDNGCGIDPQVLVSGRDGHWGLTGIRERSRDLGARLTLRSRHAIGTEVELVLSARIAYQDRPARSLLRRLLGRESSDPIPPAKDEGTR